MIKTFFYSCCHYGKKLWSTKHFKQTLYCIQWRIQNFFQFPPGVGGWVGGDANPLLPKIGSSTSICHFWLKVHTHTCDFLNYCVNLKVPEWVVYPFLRDFWSDFCLNNEGTEVQHKAGVNTRNLSRNSWENRRCEWTISQPQTTRKEIVFFSLSWWGKLKAAWCPDLSGWLDLLEWWWHCVIFLGSTSRVHLDWVPAYSEFGYYAHPITMSRFFPCEGISVIDSNVKEFQL